MAAEQSNPRASLFKNSLKLYRHTLKRFPPIHQAMHWVMTHTLVPSLESMRGFKTMPDDPFWFRVELLTNRHERETVAHFKQLVQPGMTVLDIGAHVGYYARLSSQLVGKDGRVIAFEPHPRNFQYLERNTAQLANVERLQIALAEAEGQAELYDYLMMSASGSLNYDSQLRDVQIAQTSATDVAPRIGKDFEPQVYEVRTAQVDDLLGELGITKVDFVKMDIEGAELGALRGMRRTIQQSPNLALLMEYNPLGLRAFGHEPLDVLAEVIDLGFHKLQIIEADGTLSDFTPKSTKIAQRTQTLLQTMGVVNLLITR